MCFNKRLGLLVSFLILGFLASSQTAGLIFEPAGTVAGQSVLDPDGDGYISKSTNGFQNNDRDESEISFVPLMFLDAEPSADINNGPDCGFTDFVESVDEDPGQFYFDANGNWLFRLRMGSVATNAKSYSILVDANQMFGETDPNYTSVNPGFEFEIVLATKFGVSIYDLRASNPDPCTPVINYAGNGNYQKSIAHSTICGTTNYFLDFYIKLSDLTSVFSYDDTTPFRSVIVSNMAANKSTICNISSASDIGGVDNSSGSVENILTQLIENQLPCEVTDINTGNCLEYTAAPIVSAPINSGDTDVFGTSVEVDGTVIDVFVDGVYVGTTTVLGNSWSISGLSPLNSGQIISAVAIALGKAESKLSNEVEVGAVCTENIVSVIDCGKGISGTSNVPGAIINVYQGTSVTPLVATSGSNWNADGSITVPVSGVFYWKNNSDNGETTNCTAGGGSMTAGAYRVTQQIGSQCESSGLWVCVGGLSATADASITTSPITVATTSLSGVVGVPDNVAGVDVFLYVDDKLISTSTTTSGGVFSFSGLSFDVCQKVNVQALSLGLCASNLSPDVFVSGGKSATPVVDGSFCATGNITSVSGSCREIDGALVQVYNNGVASGTPAVVSNGLWEVTDASIPAGNIITATSIASCKTESDVSSGVLVNAKNTNVPSITTSNVYEGDMIIEGVGVDGDNIYLYIDDYPVFTDALETSLATAVVSGGVWTINTIYSEALYAGGVLSARAVSGTSCESDNSNTLIIQCLPPANTKVVVAVEADYCQTIEEGQIIVRNSDPKVIYTPILTDASNTVFGYSALGNGGDLTLRTLGIPSVPLEVSVSAMKIGAEVCESINANSDEFNTLYLLPDDKALVASKTAICYNEAVDITIQSSELGINYSLINTSTGNPIGITAVGNGNDLVINTGGILSALDIGVVADAYYSAPDKSCLVEMTDVIPITGDPGCTNVLPVELLEFKANCNESIVNVFWTTASESNNDYFILERSFEGAIFNEINRIAGSGNSSTIREYIYADDMFENETVYYRLTQVDVDGTETQYPIIATKCDEVLSPPAMNVYPNPLKFEHLFVELENLQSDSFVLELVDCTGRLVFSKTYNEFHSDILKIEDLKLKSGVYMLRLVSSNFMLSQKVQKL